MSQSSLAKENNLGQILVFILILAVIIGIVVLPTISAQDAESEAVRVWFANLTDGDVVATTFQVQMAAEGVTVAPAGELVEGSGHFHILIDSDFVPAGEVIPRDDLHQHYGQGQIVTELTLPPGEHTLRLQFADGAHTALEGDQYRDEINITVE
ncbi:MAG: DUF4399 domain-containing protein [Burkholderiales bacterium]|nr:DUF4399 domain-containing protein [Anaerolineae bacterium]